MNKLILGVFTFLLACGGTEPVAVPPAPADVTQPLACNGPPEMALGRCVRTLDGVPCNGTFDEARSFVAMADGEDLTMVVGPQGATMFVLAARVFNIAPGDPQRPWDSANPIVQMTLDDDRGHELTQYRSRAGFIADPETPGMVFNAGLFVIVDEVATRMVDQRLSLEAALVDSGGQQRCGTIEFVARR